MGVAHTQQSNAHEVNVVDLNLEEEPIKIPFNDNDLATLF